jgi:hypothetical protein
MKKIIVLFLVTKQEAAINPKKLSVIYVFSVIRLKHAQHFGTILKNH